MNYQPIRTRLARSLLAVAGSCALLFSSPAQAALQCGTASLCFIDLDPWPLNVYGNVWGNNPDWGQLPGGWNDRADRFYNHTSRTVCLYGHADYRRTWPGQSNIEPRRLTTGQRLDWEDTVSSNYFANSC